MHEGPYFVILDLFNRVTWSCFKGTFFCQGGIVVEKYDKKITARIINNLRRLYNIKPQIPLNLLVNERVKTKRKKKPKENGTLIVFCPFQVKFINVVLEKPLLEINPGNIFDLVLHSKKLCTKWPQCYTKCKECYSAISFEHRNYHVVLF